MPLHSTTRLPPLHHHHHHHNHRCGQHRVGASPPKSLIAFPLLFQKRASAQRAAIARPQHGPSCRRFAGHGSGGWSELVVSGSFLLPPNKPQTSHSPLHLLSASSCGLPGNGTHLHALSPSSTGTAALLLSCFFLAPLSLQRPPHAHNGSTCHSHGLSGSHSYRGNMSIVLCCCRVSPPPPALLASADCIIVSSVRPDGCGPSAGGMSTVPGPHIPPRFSAVPLSHKHILSPLLPFSPSLVSLP
jgi:hypothetical protein